VSGSAYFDSSALVTIYVTGPFSARARQEVQNAGVLAFSPLHNLGVRNALRVLHGRKALTLGQRQMFEALLEDDLSTGRLTVTTLDLPAVFIRAARLSSAYTSRLLCRSLDILHVAAALELRATQLVSGDERQLALATATGLVAVDIRR
jgi:predicted nucleic acid-binding protein